MTIDPSVATARAVLNVGGNSKAIALPPQYDGWTHHLLDIDPTGNPDICCDARTLSDLAPGTYDAVYCSHNLEHYFAHDVPRVLAGFHHVLKPDGFIEVRVPDLQVLMETVVARKLDLMDVLYVSRAGPVHVRDVFYGFAPQIARSGVDFYAHKTGFTPKLLAQSIASARFSHLIVVQRKAGFEIIAYGFKTEPDAERLESLRLPPQIKPTRIV